MSQAKEPTKEVNGDLRMPEAGVASGQVVVPGLRQPGAVAGPRRMVP